MTMNTESAIYDGLDQTAFRNEADSIVTRTEFIQEFGQMLWQAIFVVDPWADRTEAIELCVQAARNPWKRLDVATRRRSKKCHG